LFNLLIYNPKGNNIAKVVTDILGVGAFWWDDSKIMTIGFAPQNTSNSQTPNTNNSLVTLDICAHEYTHGITQFTAGLLYSGESGALNEGISDIFGVAMERRLLGIDNTKNWTIGEDAWTIRSLSNPTTAYPPLTIVGQPDRYLGTNWDWNGSYSIHHNNGVLNKWFHTICTGQNPNANNIQAIDFDNAIKIIYRALQFYLQSSSGYYDMREATIAASRDLFGNCSFEETQVTNAWAAAAVGNVYVNNCNTVPGGVYPGCYRIVAKHANKNAQTPNNANNAAIVQSTANGGNNQIFKIENATSLGVQGLSCPSCYRIISQDNYKFVRYGPTSSSGTPVVQAFWNSSNPYNYAWRFLPNADNTFSITPGGPTNNLRIDVSGGSQIDGAAFQLWDSHGGDNQRFYLQSAACPAASTPTTCNFNVSATASSTNIACGGSVNLTANCGGDCANIQYQWSGSGLNSSGQSATATLSTTGTYQYVVTATKAGCQSQQATVDVSVSASTVCGGGFVACPSGNFGGFLDMADCNSFAGWALDHSNYGRTVDVEISVDGVKVATISANQNRSDLGAAFGTSAAIPHGWTYNVPATASWRTGTNRTVTARICGASSDLTGSPKTVNCTGGVGTPPNPTPTPTPTACASGNFGSSFDDANCNVFNGWALDHNYGRTVDVEIRVDGQLVATVPANQSRPDLAAAFGTSAAELHGWWYYPPANAYWRTGQNRTVTARICGASSDMSSSPKTVNCTGGTGTPPNPTPTPTPTPTACASGNFGGHFDTGNCAILNGWALDHNNYGRTVQVEIRVDGVLVATVQANDSRPDLVGAFGTAAAEFHGWHYNPLPSDSWRNGTKTITARICGAMSDLNNSPKTVNFSNCRVGNADQEKVVVPSRDGDLNDDLTLSPNPTNGELRFRIGLQSKTDVSVSLSDLAGRVLQTKIYKNREGSLDERLDLGDLVSGSYIFVLQTTEKRFSRKVVVLR
jgi:hypothetical protein